MLLRLFFFLHLEAELLKLNGQRDVWLLLSHYWHQHQRLLTETLQEDMIQFLLGGFEGQGLMGEIWIN